MQIEESLYHIVVLDFSIWIFILSFIWETLVASEHKVADGDLVIAGLRVNGLTVVKDVDSEIFWSHAFNLCKFLTGLQQLDVQGSAGMITGADHDLFLEDYSIFSWDVSVNVLDWLTLDHLMQSKGLFVAQGVEHKLTLSGVVGHHSFDDKAIATGTIGLELDVIQVHLVEANNVVGLGEV